VVVVDGGIDRLRFVLVLRLLRERVDCEGGAKFGLGGIVAVENCCGREGTCRGAERSEG
jgi:hypothetical protein